MTARKYELTDDSKTIDGTTLRRIRAVTSFGSFGSVCAGDLGGYVETENNLSQEGNAWVFDDAQVFYRARVFGEALAFGDARITGQSRVFDDALVSDDARVYGKAQVFGKALVAGHARVFD